MRPKSLSSFAVGSSRRSQKRIAARSTAVISARRRPPKRATRASAIVPHFCSRRSVRMMSRISRHVRSMNLGESHSALSASQSKAASAKLKSIPSSNARSSGTCSAMLPTDSPNNQTGVKDPLTRHFKVLVEPSSSISKQRSTLNPIAAIVQARPLRRLSQAQLSHRERGLSSRRAIAAEAARQDVSPSTVQAELPLPNEEPAIAASAKLKSIPSSNERSSGICSAMIRAENPSVSAAAFWGLAQEDNRH
jgi:hypothetical protein